LTGRRTLNFGGEKVVGLGELVKHKKGEGIIPFERLGFSSAREAMRIHEKLRKTHETYGNLAKAFGVKKEEVTECVLLSENQLEAVALYMVKSGKTRIDKEEFVALLMLVGYALREMKEAMERVMEMVRKTEENKAYL
jgi:hypothetical protein